MKNLFKMLSLLLLLYCKNVNAQQYVYNSVQGSQFTYLQVNTNSHKFTFVTYILDYHLPVLRTSEILIVGDTLEVKMFYDITALVFNIGNLDSYSNDVFYNQIIPQNVSVIKMSTNVIMKADNPPYNPITINDVYTKIINLNSLSNHQNSFENSSIKVFPNPTTNLINIDFGNIQENSLINMKNILGQTILTKKIFNVDKTNLEINEPNGVYLIEVINDKLEKQVFKIVKN